MKKTHLAYVLCLMLSLTILSGCFGGSKTPAIDANGETTLSYLILGDEPPEAGRVFDLINKQTVEKIGVRIVPRFVNFDNYNLALSAGEQFDIIVVGDWLQFWDFAARNAFAEIPDEMIKQYAPNVIAKETDFLSAGKIDGVRYGIPQLSRTISSNVYLVRGGFMDKYNVPDIVTLKDFGTYLAAVAENEQGIIPFDARGDEAWRIPAIFYSEQIWQSPGAPSAASHFLVDAESSNPQIFVAVDTPEARELSLMMQDWNRKGFWSRNAMANTISTFDSFMNGRSASAIVSLETALKAYHETKADDRASWDVRFFNIYNTRTDAASYMNGGFAIGRNSQHMGKALAFADLIHSDLNLSRLLTFGIEGVHWSLQEDGRVNDQDLARNQYPGPAGIFHGLYNDTAKSRPIGSTAESDAIYDLIEKIYKPSRVLNFRSDTSAHRTTMAALNDIYSQHTAPRFLGFVDDVDAAIQNERKLLTNAGIDNLITALQEQLDRYIDTLGW